MKKPYFIYEITARCNNNCLYCYNVWKEEHNYDQRELSFDKTKELFDKLFDDISPSGITIAGGEPLLHPNIFDVVLLLSKKTRVGIATNGLLLDEEKISKLIENGVIYFEISLPTLNPGTYKHLCGSEQLEIVRKAVLLIKNGGSKLTISFVATKLNLEDISDVIDLSFAFLADTVAINRFVPGGRGLDYLSELSISDKELLQVLVIADKKSKEYKMPINITIPIESCIINHKEYPNLNFGSCVCGKEKWVIDPFGNLRTCEQNPQVIGNLLSSNFSELSQSESVKSFQENNFSISCEKCGRFENCGGGCRFVRSHKT
ncbi:hypothetical protein A2526_04675 [candidate division WOR-1 bacterium RIFOXYD2_FULL_36_8]|uniref:Radical SAM core domain-containing protein n=2 Tax=Bacteria TaxID=2 RepID=A0A1F4S1M6_UNCSA|nr:MAG: hypothetical protein A2290_04980 [candidate division WOR-1 bacterium RIFOXYB2_FULL_36_35]OGC19902.1 MAG: hypothetical protein A2282_04755 [candidate division WOR-1 bacterium RIFOXYA12_FULL_36_13]OGC39734.1 MAG: hypothetical protein A2526_04675 [candidate division WOR-1 bacterium RIFOXYD2_FULL_36_8]OGF21749.1 MAG: hypothetical protein A2257_00055 [Candidatus Falkowbacteria bacterium RIFOXYA2_FULL_38_12]